MRTITVRLPKMLAAAIEAESRGRKISKSDAIRECLSRGPEFPQKTALPLPAIADLIGSLDGLPPDLSAHKKRYLQTIVIAASVIVDASFIVTLLCRQNCAILVRR